MKQKYLYMAVTNDSLELPLAVADNGCQLARLFGVKYDVVKKQISRPPGKVAKVKYIRILLEEEC